MLQITDQATTHLLRARTERGFDEQAGARFVRSSVGVGLTFSPAPEPGDEVLAGSALPIYVAEDITACILPILTACGPQKPATTHEPTIVGVVQESNAGYSNTITLDGGQTIDVGDGRSLTEGGHSGQRPRRRAMPRWLLALPRDALHSPQYRFTGDRGSTT
jgi:hypothetical protein